MRRHFQITKNASDLGGSRRFLSDGLATSDDCKNLLYVANTFSSLNDGYNDGNFTIGTSSPHTKHEKFEGVALSRMAFLVYIGVLEPTYLQLVLDLTEEVRSRLVEKFEIEEDVYFSYTHLVCRTALPGAPRNRSDLSHTIHSDNCILLNGNVCEKKSPAFYWRDYSAILYLNEDFEGGEFLFASDSKGRNIQSTIRPKCGRTVAFSSGSENLHGVKAVTKGKRCALAIWFTLDPKHREFDRDVAHHMLENGITFQQYAASSDISEMFHDAV